MSSRTLNPSLIAAGAAALACLLGSVPPGPLAAQDVQEAAPSTIVTGSVTSDDGVALPSATVRIPSLDLAAIVGNSGRYQLEVPASRVDGQTVALTASALGYRAVTVNVALTGGSITQDFQLPLDPIGLSEIVATGQGRTRARQELGTTINTVDATDIADSQEENVVAALAGKAPNVWVEQTSGEPGAGAYLTIRGFKTLKGSNQPLFVVDGSIIDNSTAEVDDPTDFQNDRTAGVTSQNRAADIDPDDIQSIEILKGPAASAIYGAKAANGVVIITTKSGQAGTTQATLKSSYSFDDVNAYNDLQREFGQGFENPPGSGNTEPDIVTWGAALEPGTRTFDHAGELFKTGHRWDSNLTLAGGSDQTTYFLSGGYVDHDGFIRGNSANDKVSVRLKGSHGFLDNLTLTGNVAYTNQALDLIQKGSNTSGLLLGALRTPPEFNNCLPNANPCWTDPETGLHRSYRNPNPTSVDESRGYDNPFFVANEILNTSDVDRTFGNVRIDWEPLPWLSISETLGADFWEDKQTNLFPKGSSEVVAGRLIRGSYQNFTIDNTLMVTATHDFSDILGGSLSVGQNVGQSEYERYLTQGDNLILGGSDLDATVVRVPDEYRARTRTEGYFAEANADLWDQLYLTAGVRYDGFSTFGADKQRYWFPNANVAWEFSQLPAFQDLGWLDYGKLRGAWGRAGEEPPVFSNLTTFQTATFTDGWISSGGFGLESIYRGREGIVTEFTLGNEAIEPEITDEFEAGLDLAFLDSRLAFGFTYYNQQTKDAIVQLPLPPTSGFDSRFANGAEFSNEGFEITMDATPVRSRAFAWELNAQWGTNDNVVEDLLGAEVVELDGFQGSAIAAAKDICGPTADQPCSFGVITGVDYIRFGRDLSADTDCNVATPDANIDEAFPGATAGSYFIGCDGFPLLDSRIRVLGDPNPSWQGSVRNTFTVFENLRLSALVDVVQDKDMWNGTRGALYFFGTHAGTAPMHGAGMPFTFAGSGPGAGEEVILDSNWTLAGIGSGFTGGDNLFVEDASFVKLRDVSARYTFDQPFLLRSIGFGRAEISVSGRNLVTWTDYTGLDPESNLTEQSSGRGLEYFNNPNVRSWIVGVSLVR